MTEGAELIALLGRLLLVVAREMEMADNGRLELGKDLEVWRKLLLLLQSRTTVDNLR